MAHTQAYTRGALGGYIQRVVHSEWYMSITTHVGSPLAMAHTQAYTRGHFVANSRGTLALWYISTHVGSGALFGALALWGGATLNP